MAAEGYSAHQARVSRIIQSTIKKDKSDEESSEETGAVAGNKRERTVPESQELPAPVLTEPATKKREVVEESMLKRNACSSSTPLPVSKKVCVTKSLLAKPGWTKVLVLPTAAPVLIVDGKRSRKQKTRDD